MPRRLLKLVTQNLSRESVPHLPAHTFTADEIGWAMGSFCALNRKPFDAVLLLKQFPPPYSSDSFIHAARALGFRIKRRDCSSKELAGLNFPCMVVLHEAGQPAGSVEPHAPNEHTTPKHRPAIVVKIEPDNVIFFETGSNQPKTLTQAEFEARYAGTAFQLALESQSINDPDGALEGRKTFGFRWFIPELMKHKRIWRDVVTELHSVFRLPRSGVHATSFSFC